MKKYRHCPHCKGKQGFELRYKVVGHGSEKRDFNGNVLDAERYVADDTDRHVTCLDCGEHIDIEKVETE